MTLTSFTGAGSQLSPHISKFLRLPSRRIFLKEEKVTRKYGFSSLLLLCGASLDMFWLSAVDIIKNDIHKLYIVAVVITLTQVVFTVFWCLRFTATAVTLLSYHSVPSTSCGQDNIIIYTLTLKNKQQTLFIHLLVSLMCSNFPH